jgi:hypothetical protein
MRGKAWESEEKNFEKDGFGNGRFARGEVVARNAWHCGYFGSRMGMAKLRWWAMWMAW